MYIYINKIVQFAYAFNHSFPSNHSFVIFIFYYFFIISFFIMQFELAEIAHRVPCTQCIPIHNWPV